MDLRLTAILPDRLRHNPLTTLVRASLLRVDGLAPMLRMFVFRSVSFRIDRAPASLPSNSNNTIIFNENGNPTSTSAQRQQATLRLPVRFDVEFIELASQPLQPVAIFLCVGATGGAEEFKPCHRPVPCSRRC